MLCIHTDISNKPGLIVNDLSASASHASDFELDSIAIKPEIILKILAWITVWSLSPRNQEHKVSLFQLVIIVERLVILDQIIIYWNPTGLGISRFLLKKARLRIPLLINMSLPIGDIYLKNVRTLFCVKMLPLKL
jgi:hypothetical protein